MAYQIINRKFIDYQGRELSFPYFSGFDPITAKYTMQGEFAITFSSLKSVFAEDNQLTLVSGSWEDYGFISGAGISGTYGANTVLPGTTITYIDGSVMVISATLVDSDDPYISGTLFCDDAPDALELFFNLVPNQNGAENEFSLIDNEVNKFTVNLNSLAVGATTNFTRAGNFSGGSIMNSNVKRLADSGTKRIYELSINFKVWTVKLPGLYLTTNCVKPWLKIRVMPEFNNPTVYTDLINSPSDANTGWLNERGNGNLPDYTKTGIIWKSVSGNILNSFDYSQPSIFETTITGFFNSSSVFNIGWLFDSIDDEDYKNLPLSLENNLMMIVSNSPLMVGSSANITGAARADGANLVLSEILISQTGTTATIKGKLTPNAQFTAFFESKEPENRKYEFAIRCEDPRLDNNLINPVWVEIDSASAEKEILPLGGYPLSGQRIYGHEESITEGGSLFIEDDIRINTRFKLPKGILYDSIQVGMVAYNTVTGENFTLESKLINLGAYPLLPDGISPVDYSSPVDFNLSPTNPHKVVEMVRRPSLDDATNYGVEINYSTILNWRYWIQLLQASYSFYPNQNNNWFNYEGGNWIVGFAIKIFTNDGAYENILPVTFKNYDDFSGTSIIKYYKLDGTPLTKPLTNEKIVLECTHTPTGGVDLTDEFWSQMTVEGFENSPRWDSSSVYPWGNIIENPLSPMPGEIGLQMTLSPTQIITKCIYDPGKVTNPGKISFTGRFSGKNKSTSNRTKKTETAAKLPKPKIVEDRGANECECDCELLVFASLTESETYKNCISSRWQIGENVEFELQKNGNAAAWQPSTQSFANDVNAFYATITWKDVLISDGIGCYKLFANYEVAGISGTELVGEFKLIKFSFPRLNNKVRIRAVFNDANDYEQINFTNSFVVDDMVIDGDMNNFDPNTRIENWTFANKEQNKSVRENETKYTLRGYMDGYCILNPLINLFFLAENQMYISDYNRNAYDPNILDYAVIVSESAKMKDFDNHNKKGFEIVFTKKFQDQYSHFGAVGISGLVNDPLVMIPNTVEVPIDPSVNAVAVNSEGTVIATGTVTPDDPEILIPDEVTNIYYYGVLVNTSTTAALAEKNIYIA